MRADGRIIMALCGTLALAGCGDATGPGNASEDDRQDVLAVLDESGWFAETFGEQGLVETSVAAGFQLHLSGVAADAADTVPLVRRWGRRHGRPVTAERTVNVEGDTARASVTLVFEGEFVLDRTADDVRNPTSKPMHHTVTQQAVLVRRADTDSAGRRWRLVALTPRRAVMTDPDRRTVVIEQVTILRNGETVLDITSGDALLAVEGGLPVLEVGDEIDVIARVTNTTGHDNVPQTFVFLHLFHASPDTRIWLRRPMEDQGDGTWVWSWTVRQPGRERIMVDAIDSQTFATDGEDDYRTNIWGVPYRVGG